MTPLQWINSLFVRIAHWYAEANLKRCRFCDLPFDDQVHGVDGAMCDSCVEIHAPWVNEPVDPMWAAMMAAGTYPYWFHDHEHRDGIWMDGEMGVYE